MTRRFAPFESRSADADPLVPGQFHPDVGPETARLDLVRFAVERCCDAEIKRGDQVHFLSPHDAICARPSNPLLLRRLRSAAGPDLASLPCPDGRGHIEQVHGLDESVLTPGHHDSYA
jgi:hypothetical protein